MAPKKRVVTARADFDVLAIPDAGNDLELYVILSILVSDGRGVIKRVPGDGWWSAPIGANVVRDAILIDFDLYQGQTAEVAITVMEEDNGNPLAGWVSGFAAAILTALGRPDIAAGVRAVVDNYPTNEDDVIGTVIASVRTTGKGIHVEWQGVAGSGYEGSDPVPNGIHAHFVGEGADNVFGTFRITS